MRLRMMLGGTCRGQMSVEVVDRGHVVLGREGDI